MLLVDRTWQSTTTYKYGFNNQEQDDEIYGNGNLNIAEFWEYDTRIGKRWNVDPVVKFHESPYACFANNPIWFVDFNGADSTVYFYSQNYGDERVNKKTMRSIMNETKQIFIENGVTGLSFKLINENEAKALIASKQLDPSDAILAVFPSGWVGFSPGSTRGMLNPDGTSIDNFGTYSSHGLDEYDGSYIDLLALDVFRKMYGANVTDIEFYAQAAAHEILHQYLMKASLMFTGASYNLVNSDENGHSTILAPNLNTEGTYIWKVENFTKDIDGRFSAERMLAVHKNAINIYLLGVKKGLSADGSQASSSLSQDLIKQWRTNVLINHSKDGIYAK